MKRFLFLLFLLLALPLCAQADVDLSGMSFDELVALRDQINLAIWQSDTWQEVTVPQGIWQIGVDIPEGHWTIRPVGNSYANITYGNILESNGKEVSYKSKDYYYETIYSPSSFIYDEGEDLLQIDIDAKAGSYIEIEYCDVIFAPYIGKQSLGFSKSGVAFASPTATPVPVVNGYPALDFSKLSRNPENFIGSKAFSTGRVVQVIGSRDEGYNLRFAVDDDSDKMIYLVIFPGESMPSSNILDNDHLEVFLTLKGDYSYETVFGSTVTLPLAFVDSLNNLSE